MAAFVTTSRRNWMRRSSLGSLDVVRHRVRRLQAPYVLVLQHPDIPSPTILTAPVALMGASKMGAIAPILLIGDIAHRVRLLDITAVPLEMLGDTVMSATEEGEAIMAAFDIILHGYPVRRPF
jgi:hypothetical protein